MRTFISWLRGKPAFALIGLFAMWAVAARATDVTFYAVTKGQSFVQAGTGAAVAAGGNSVQFSVEVDFNGNNTVTNASVKLPNSTVMPLSSGGGDQLKLKQDFATTNALEAAFPDGTYTLTIQAVDDGNHTNTLNLTGQAYPTTPHFNNFTAAQAVDPSASFNLGWDVITGATSNDFVQVSIDDCSGNTVFQSPELDRAGALTGLATNFIIPAGALRLGQTYNAQLLAGRGTTFDTNSYPGATGLAAYFKQVQMSFVTIGTQTGCSFGTFQLVFNFASGSFGGGTVGSITFPQSINYYFALFNVNNDTNYPDTVTFTGPVGSGLNNTTNQNNGSSFGTSAFYSSPSLNTPPFPPGGVYTVNYKGSSNDFNLLNPNAASQQVIIIPSVVLNASNVITQINWSYRNTNGAVIAAPPFMNNVAVRVLGFSGSLYDTESDNIPISPAVTNYVPPVTINWTNVTSIGMVWSDLQGNQYDSYWIRNPAPVAITTLSLPAATQGSFYSFLLSASGGSAQYTWSVPSNSLPAGLTLNPVTGEISGTPSHSGTSNFIVTVTDTLSASTNRSLSLLVNGTGPARPVLSSPVMLANGRFKFHVSGVSGQSYTLQTSSDLFNWTSLITIDAPASSFDITDPNTTNVVRRFYRIMLGP